MGKFRGRIGFVTPIDIGDDIWEEAAVERIYRGDLNRESMSFSSTTNINDDLVVANEISIVADSYLLANSQYMKYIELEGVRWSIRKIEVRHPRLILTLGGVWNGKTP